MKTKIRTWNQNDRSVDLKYCIYCGNWFPENEEFFPWHDGRHKYLRNKCRNCCNFDSKLSHRIRRARLKDESK